VLGFDPVQSKVVSKLYANGMVRLRAVAVGVDDTVYAANPVAEEIHMPDPDVNERISALVGWGIFGSPQGLVPIPGTRLFIVSYHGYGLAVLDIGKGDFWRITGGKS
jgi:hypothetical protein